MYEIRVDRIFALHNDLIITKNGVDERRLVELHPVLHRRTGEFRWNLRGPEVFIGVSDTPVPIVITFHSIKNIYIDPVIRRNGMDISILHVNGHSHLPQDNVRFLIQNLAGDTILEKGVKVGDIYT